MVHALPFVSCVIASDNQPTALWVWDMTSLTLVSVVVQMGAIKCAAWDPKSTRIALCTGNDKVYLWTPSGCSCVEVPAGRSCMPCQRKRLAATLTLAFGCCIDNFQVFHLRWAPDGQALVLQNKSGYCLCYPADL